MSHINIKKVRILRSSNTAKYSSIARLNSSGKKRTHNGANKRIFIRNNSVISNSSPVKNSLLKTLSLLIEDKIDSSVSLAKKVNEFHGDLPSKKIMVRNFKFTQANKRHLAIRKTNRQRRRQKGMITFSTSNQKKQPLLRLFNKAYIK